MGRGIGYGYGLSVLLAVCFESAVRKLWRRDGVGMVDWGDG